jgi:hypothetical protein
MRKEGEAHYCTAKQREKKNENYWKVRPFFIIKPEELRQNGSYITKS